MNKFLFWFPRILGIFFIVFISLFALDIFGQGYSFWQTVLGLFMHLIPSFVLIITLIVAWKWRKAGGLIYLIIGILSIFIMRGNFYSGLLISAPLLLIGILFLSVKDLPRLPRSH